MYKVFSTLLAALLITTSAVAAPKQITISGVDGPSVVAPIAFKYSDPTFSGNFSAVDEDGKKWPVTVQKGKAVIVAPTSSSDKTYTLKRAKKSKLKVKKDKKENRIDVTLGKETFTAFHYQADQKKPFLWPVLGHNGAPITRDWPMGKENITKDHPHHQSFYTAYGDIDGFDYWHKTFTTPSSVTFENHAAYSTITADIIWHKEKDDLTPHLTERRVYTFYNTPSENRIFDLSTTLIASEGEVKFNDTKEGGMATVRMNDDLQERDGNGVLTNSEGLVGEKQLWGKPAAWCDYSGSLEEFGNVGFTIMDHPSSFRFPTHWHARSYGLLGANAFGYSYFYGKNSGKNGDLTLKKTESITFNYRMYVHQGNVAEAHVADQYTQWATPSKVTVH